MAGAGDLERDRQFREAALEVVLRSYDNHKNHARFQETQRSWFFIAYFSISGIIGSAIFNRMLQPGQLDASTRAIMVVGLIVLALIGVMIGMAIIKVGVEFRRHFHQAEAIIAHFQLVEPKDEVLQALLKCARMGTTGDESTGLRRFLAKRFGVAALHNYMMALIIGMELGVVATLVLPAPGWAGLVFPVATAVAITGLQAYRRTIWSSLA